MNTIYLYPSIYSPCPTNPIWLYYYVQVILPSMFELYANDFPPVKNDELFKWLFQFLPTNKRLDLLLLLEWNYFVVVYRK